MYPGDQRLIDSVRDMQFSVTTSQLNAGGQVAVEIGSPPVTSRS